MLVQRPRKLLALGFVTTFLLYTLFGFFVVPWIIRKQIESQAQTSLHRTAHIRQVRFNPFTLATTIDGFDLADRDGVSLYAFDRLLADFQLSGLFRRAARFREIRLDRPVLSARILPDGHPSIADLIESKDGGDAPAAPYHLPRLIVDRLVVNAGVVQFSDASRNPSYQTRFEPLSLDVRNLITIPEEGGEHTVTIGVEDGAVIRWTGRQMIDPLRLQGRFEISNLNLRRIGEYFGRGQMLQVQDGRVNVSLPYEIRRTTDQNFEVKLDGASVAVHSLAVRPNDETADWLTVPEIRVDKVKAVWPAARLDVGSVQLNGANVLARIGEDGLLNWSNALHTNDATPATDSALSKWQYIVGSVAIDGGAITFEDAAAKPAVALKIADISMHAEKISSKTAEPVPLTLKARVAEKGLIEISGSVARSPMNADLKFDGNGLQLDPLRSYVESATGLPIDAGRASMRGEIAVADDGRKIKLSGAGDIDDVALEDPNGDRLMSWGRMSIDGLTYETPPNRARIRKITVDRPSAKIHIDAEGRLNLSGLVSSPKPAAATAPAPSSGSAVKLEIGSLELQNGTAEFQDESLLLPFRAEIHSASGALKDLSSFASAPATLSIEGQVDKTGYVKAGGTLRISDPMAASEIGVEFRSIEMSDLTPYFAQFAGYRVRSGVLDLDIRYVVKDRRLIGNHTLNARDLVLGERVKDSKAPGLAVRLAVALLKDKEGRINISVPVEGTVDSPDFNYRKVFWSAVQTILGNAAKAPFRAIGRLFGRDEDDLELVEFDMGRSDLLPAEAEKLSKLAEQIGPKREIVLNVEGRYDPAADQTALKKARLEKLIDSRRDAVAASAAGNGSSTLETVLESLYTEQFSAEGLNAERQRFVTNPAGTSGTTSGPPVFDAASFYEGLRARLLDAQQVTDADLTSLASARAATIAATLTKTGAVESGRVSIAAPTAVKRKKAGSARAASEVTMSTEGDADDK